MVTTILHNFASLNLGGAESRTMDIYRALDKNEFQFEFVIYDQGSQFFEKEILSAGGVIHRITKPRENIIKHVLDLNALLRSKKYDAVHSHTSYHSGLVTLLSWVNRVPIRIAHARTSGSLSITGVLGKISQKIGQALLSTFTTKKLAISSDAGLFVFGKNADFQILPNAFDLAKFDLTTAKAEIRSKLRLPLDSIIIGQVGRFSPVKNHDFSIHLLKILNQTNPGTTLVFVGDGPEKEKLVNLAITEKVENNIVFAGIQSNIPEWLTAFDLVLMPSFYEGLGVAVLEAQAAGTPVVASTGVPRSTDIGLSLVNFVSLDDMNAWIHQIHQSLHLTPPTWERINQAFSEKNFTLETAVNEHIKLYKG